MQRILSSLVAAAAVVCCAGAAAAQGIETVLVNGKILTVDRQSSVRSALAIREGRIAALGSDADMRKLAGAGTRIIDLQGRTVIPGLIDSHMHATRAALSFSTEVNWIGAASLADGLSRLHEASLKAKPGAWLIVVTPAATLDTFKERRRPTQAELIAAAPNHPVYVQLGYGWAMMTPLALDALHITSADGVITNNIIELFDRLPKPTFDEQVAGTKAFFRELNRLGITGVVDPGGNNVTPREYQALFKVWHDGQLTVRVAYSLCGMTDGSEFGEYQNYLAMMPQGFGDDMLHFNGIGERITWAMNGINGIPPEADKAKYYEIVRWAAQRGLTVTMHWNTEANVDQLLGIWERVNKEFPIAPLRWTIAHLNDASPATLQRMKALGVGWTVQDALYNTSDDAAKREGAAKVQRQPPVVTGNKIGVTIGAGTDAHRVSTYNPFTVLQWFLDGKNAGGTVLRGPEETPSRADALRFYTSGSAWVSHDEDKRGSLEVGKFADLAVLSKDYMTVPVDQIGGIESLLTMTGGRVVYAAGPFQAFEGSTARVGSDVMQPAPAIAGVIAAGTKAEVLVRGLKSSDDPIWVPNVGLLFTESQANRVVRLGEHGEVSTFVGDLHGPLGMTFDAQGRLISLQSQQGFTGPRVIWPAGKEKVLADGFEGRPFGRPNDVVSDRKGGVYFSDLPLRPAPAGLMAPAVYYVPPGGAPIRVADDIARPNGVQLSRDEKTLYVNDTGGIHAYAFDVLADGRLANRRVFATYVGRDESAAAGGEPVANPDGLVVDDEGRVYALTEAGIEVIAANGQHLGVIPAWCITRRCQNLAFGGPDKRTLYVAGGGTLLRIPMLSRGFTGRAK